MKVLVTGSAGFIGFHVARRLLDLGHSVVGIDGFTAYYDVDLKRQRHQILAASPLFDAHEVMLEDAASLARVWHDAQPDIVIHLAAQAGVRYSLENPQSYVGSNLIGSFNVLELARQHPVQHLLLASSSSTYGMDEPAPFAETAAANHPITLYAATKKSMEVMAHSYAHLFAIPITTFRFFTVYGPWGRPDMALFKFVANILDGKPIDIYNHGKMLRDFTYIDDLVEAVVRLTAVIPPQPGPQRPMAVPHDSLSATAAFRIVNIGNAAPVPLLTFIKEVERSIGQKAERRYLEMQPGDVLQTFADTRLLEALTGFRPATQVAEGVRAFVLWYREVYRPNVASSTLSGST
jgi:UDP-glucuronate 4-epimerase